MILVYRILWQVHPGLFTCGLFWLTVFLKDWRDYRLEDGWGVWRWRLWCTIGAASNAIVTMANKGFMPFTADGDDESFSIWVRSSEATRLTLLSDVLPAGTSIGDWFIFAGLLLVVTAMLTKRQPKDEAFPRLMYARALRDEWSAAAYGLLKPSDGRRRLILDGLYLSSVKEQTGGRHRRQAARLAAGQCAAGYTFDCGLSSGHEGVHIPRSTLEEMARISS